MQAGFVIRFFGLITIVGLVLVDLSESKPPTIPDDFLVLENVTQAEEVESNVATEGQKMLKKIQKNAHSNSRYSFQAPSIEENLKMMPSARKQESPLVDLVESRMLIIAPNVSKVIPMNSSMDNNKTSSVTTTTTTPQSRDSGAILFPNADDEEHEDRDVFPVTEISNTTTLTTTSKTPVTNTTDKVLLGLDDRILLDSTPNCQPDEIYVMRRCHKSA